MFIIGGVNVLETQDLALEVASAFSEICRRWDRHYIFKGSFDKANRTSLSSYRGPGVEQGLDWLSAVKQNCDVSVITDIHDVSQVEVVAGVVDAIQIPAFLARQTDLILEAARSGLPLHVKKPQFMSPTQTKFIVEKISSISETAPWICERGSCLGYDNLVVDMLGIDWMKNNLNCPIIFDANHSLQTRGASEAASGGRAAQIRALARSAIAVGIDGLFLEVHPNPEQALCDGPSTLRLDELEDFLEEMFALDHFVKSDLGRRRVHD